MSFDVTCAVPRAGRTLTNFLCKLQDLGADATEIKKILSVIEVSKNHSSPNLYDVFPFYQKAMQNGPPCFTIYVDRKRDQRPYRVGFLSYEWEINGIRLRVEGEEPHNGSSLIKLDEIDFTVVGLDELLSMTQYYLKDPTLVTKWGMYNYHLEKPTGIRVAGSASLYSYHKSLQRNVQDIVGFFLISKNKVRWKLPLDWNNLSQIGHRVFVKGRYAGLIATAYPGLKIISVTDVEDAVLQAERGSVGVEIVQSGNTVRKKGLVLHGKPLFLSESLYVVDYDRFRENDQLKQFIENLQPMGYFAEERLEQFALWYHALEHKLGDSWLDKPELTELFCEESDPQQGLRPYRLQTRYWKPDDHYQQEKALETVIQSKRKLLHFYQQIQQECFTNE